ncbi:MAG: TIGR02452 family protein [Actinomycetota bacterium]
MKRSTRIVLARETISIAKAGGYAAPSGRMVQLSPAIKNCLKGTRFLTPEVLEQLRQKVLASPSPGIRTSFEVVNETTLEGIERLSVEAGPIAALSFASAKNPGGGVFNGSQAQEESLARSSALYPSLLRGEQYYQRHRADASMLYTDAMIYSPACPIFRNDEGHLLEEPRLAGFITSAAPNAGAAADSRPEELPLIPETFLRRSEYVLALAAAEGYRRLILGAWGCGVFRNDPCVVAAAFAAHLLEGAWRGRFERVVFSVLDKSVGRAAFNAFQGTFAPANGP